MDGVTEGRAVHFVTVDGKHRAALIVRNWGTPDGSVNLQVFYDGSNDDPHALGAMGEIVNRWETSVHFSEEPTPRTWHWIERV